MSIAPSLTPSKDTLACSEHALAMQDGVELFYRAWLPQQPATQALFLLHRGHEHSGRFTDVVDELGLRDTALFAWDARGHGRSPGERGHAPSFATIVQDLDHFVRTVSAQHAIPLENVIVLGHSVAAVVASAWVHDYAPPIRGMVLLTPALRVKLYVPLAIPGLRLLQAVRGDRPAFVTSYVRSTMLTHDRDEARRYDQDPLIARSIAVNVLLDLHDTSTRLLADAAAIHTPTLLLTAGKDWVVSARAQRRFFERLNSPVKRMRVFPRMYHDLLHEAQREEVLDEIRSFMNQTFERPPQKTSLIAADECGHTKREYDRLRRPAPVTCPKGWWYSAQRSVLRTAGRLSDGVRLGWETGFDSGQSLDYVYNNQANGRLLIGRWADRVYLDSPGWRGIRQRKKNLQRLLQAAIERCQAAHQPVRIVDVAAGCGRYVLETVAALPGDAVESVLLRDFDPANLAEAKKLAEELQLANVKVEQADAFDEQGLAALAPPATIAIVSGLYELFPENAPVLASLRGIAGALRGGGILLYTGQPWHPQLEMIARVLDNRQRRPWVMRRRTQQELDDLVRAAGFEKTGMQIDRWGIFTVSMAQVGAWP